MASRSGLIARYIRVTGKMIWLMVKVRFSMLEVISMKVSGSKIKLTGKVNTLTVMGLNTMGNGSMTSNMVRALNSGKIYRSIVKW